MNLAFPSFPRREGIRINDKMGKSPCVYVLSSQQNGTLYTSVTGDLIKRIWEHKNHLVEGFSKKYGTDILVYFEMHVTMEVAIMREKQIKKWNRKWKLRLIEKHNPEWNDLFDEICR